MVLYAEDTAQARRIAGQVDEDPGWELVALCGTLADLNFVLDRVAVDVLLLRLTPETGEGVLSAVWEQTRQAHLPVPVQACVRKQFRMPDDRPLVGRELSSAPGSREGEFWAFLSLMPQLGSTCRTAKDIVGAEAYSRCDGREWPNDDVPCSTLA
jgi:hypothetical protein